MKIHLLLFLFAVVAAQTECPQAPESPQDRRSDKSKLTIATYNGEWLFMDRYNCPGTGCPWTTNETALEHIKTTAQVMKDMNVDIINVVEVQNCAVLKLLIEFIGDDSYLPYLVKGTDTGTGQNVGLITRVDPIIDLQRTENRTSYPIPGTKCGNSTSGSTGVSKHYYTQFNIEGLDKPLSIIGIHLLAFPDRLDRCLQREAQATVIQQLAIELRNAGSSVIILGDLNDFDGTIIDPANNEPISQVLKILRNVNDEMYNVAASVSSEPTRYSCWYNRDDNCETFPLDERTLIDHLLISKDLQGLVSSAHIYNNLYTTMCDTLYSDHWPVAVTLKTGSDNGILMFAIVGSCVGVLLVVAAVVGIVYWRKRRGAQNAERTRLLRK